MKSQPDVATEEIQRKEKEKQQPETPGRPANSTAVAGDSGRPVDQMTSLLVYIFPIEAVGKGGAESYKCQRRQE